MYIYDQLAYISVCIKECHHCLGIMQITFYQQKPIEFWKEKSTRTRFCSLFTYQIRPILLKTISMFIVYDFTANSKYNYLDCDSSKESMWLGWNLLTTYLQFLLSVSGFWHEQSRADRDKNVEIMWDNINPNMKYNFMKYTLTQIQHLNAPYDTCSVMHYSGTAFSRVSKLVRANWSYV